MIRRGRGARTPLMPEINVVSLIDVMMLLMIIFMITAPMMTGGVDVSLPKAEARPLDAKSPLVVSVTQDGRIYVDDVELSLAEFRQSFKSIADQSGSESVYLRGDQRGTFGQVVRVLAIMRASGVGNIGMVAEPEDIPR